MNSYIGYFAAKGDDVAVVFATNAVEAERVAVAKLGGGANVVSTLKADQPIAIMLGQADDKAATKYGPVIKVKPKG